MTEKTCAACRFLEPKRSEEYTAIGECRRLPPVMMMVWAKHTIIHEQHWPYMQATDWCGEFAEAEDRPHLPEIDGEANA